jgi:SAM-dependent methyltransferase
MENAEVYDRYYYQHGCGLPYERSEHWLNFFGQLADHIIERINPKSVLDVGCAMGFLVESLRDRGVEAYGVDISEYAIENVRQDIKPYCKIQSIFTPTEREYDLIVCIEVLEHLPASEARQAIANLCRNAHKVLFSSTPLDYREATHLNVQPPEYWSELFALESFIRDIDFDASFIQPWSVLYRKSTETLPRIIYTYERRLWLLWKENWDIRPFLGQLRNQLSMADEQINSLSVQNNSLVEQINALTKQNSSLMERIDWLSKHGEGQNFGNEVEELREQLVNKEVELSELKNQISEIQSSETWRALKFISRIRKFLSLTNKQA